VSLIGLANKLVIVLGTLVPFSPWKVWLYRRLGFRIGKHVRIRGASFIYARAATLGNGVVIEPRTRIVCDELTMGDESKIDSETTVFGGGPLEMARGSYIGPRAWVNCEAQVSLGRGTGVGPGSSIYTHGVWLPYVDGYPRKFAPVILEDDVWIPGNVTIQPGVRIGRSSMVGAGAVVTKDIPPNSFAAGCPATVISSMDSIRANLGPDDVRGRVREVLDDFLRHLERRGVLVQRGADSLYAQGRTGGLRNRTFSLMLLEHRPSPEDIRPLLDAEARSELIVVLAQGADEAVLDAVAGRPAAHWLDIPTKRCSATWTGFAYELRRYFASHYGTRFLLA